VVSQNLSILSILSIVAKLISLRRISQIEATDFVSISPSMR
jgi:hypothetical protein